jgi:hypothetical protein
MIAGHGDRGQALGTRGDHVGRSLLAETSLYGRTAIKATMNKHWTALIAPTHQGGSRFLGSVASSNAPTINAPVYMSPQKTQGVILRLARVAEDVQEVKCQSTHGG